LFRLGISSAVLIAIVLVALPSAATAAQPERETAAMRLGRMIARAGCTLGSAEPERWREAGPADYAGPQWKLWREQTGAADPWRAEGDFNGDGVADVAKVMVRDDGRWMLGVEFQASDTAPCRMFEIAANLGHSPAEAAQLGIQGVMRLPRGERGAVCHYVIDRGPALCLRPVGTNASELMDVVDALATFDAQPASVRAYLWSRSYWDAASNDFEFVAMDDERGELRFNQYQVMRELNLPD
jgi:hypothetical protein